MTTEAPTESLAGNYAGPVTRLAAYALDALISVGLYGVVLSLVAFLGNLIFSRDLELPVQESPVWVLGLLAWLFVYYGGSWALTGKTIGMALLGLRVVARDGSDLNVGRSFLRAAAFPLSFLPLGLGLIGIVIGRERRALHDVIAGSTVVYDWDARMARWRILNRERVAQRDRSG